MKWLTNFKSFIFALFFTTIGVISWGQTLSLQNPSEPYSSTNPYIISSVADWNTFATDGSYWNKHIKLSDDWNNATEPITTMAYGDGYTPFSGIFDGNNKTLTICYTDETGSGYAPFYYTDGATIENLTVTGTITATGGYAAGLIYSNTDDNGNTTVQNVTVSATISASGQEYCAGFAVYSYALDFVNCVFNGTINAGANSGGFSASDYYNYPGPANFTDCIFSPQSGSSITSGYTFAKNIVSYATCYYTSLANTTAQGQIAYKTTDDIPANVIAKKVTAHGIDVYGKVEVVISGINDVYQHTGSTISISPIITFDGVSPSETCYTAAFTPSPVQECGEYNYVVWGNNSYHYYGSHSKTFYVVKEDFTGAGTAESPYEIANAGDWYCLAYYVNNGNSYSGKYFKLTNDINVSTMVGTSEHPFKGHFSGQVGATNDTKTLTFNYGTSGTPTEEEIVAPFRYTDGATIEFLQVSGTIYTKVGKQAGLIGVNTRTSTNTNITKVVIRVNFYCNEALWDSEGGGVAYDGSGITFNSCAYQGLISTNNYHGGICGKANSNTTLTNCLFNPSDGEGSIYWAQNFVYDEQGATLNYTTCYYSEGNNHEEST